MTSRDAATDINAIATPDGRFAGKTDDPQYNADFAISADRISKRFKVKETGSTVQALNNVNVQVARGELTAIVGPDGAGKTTFLRLVSGLMRPDTGALQVLGIDVIRDPQAVQDRISYMPQKFGLYEDLSVQENLDLYADLHGVAQDVRRARFASLLEMTDLKRFTARLAGKLSGGMKQKLGLACTLVRSPQLLLLDEPTVGVDPLSRRELWEIVQQLRERENLSVLLTTAYLDEAERCARVYVLHDGQLLSSGPPEKTSEHAQDLCYLVRPASNEHPRQLQAQLLDNTAAVIDAVPEAGDVRVIRRPGSGLSQLQLNARKLKPTQARLEDGFMVLLRTGVNEDVDPASITQPENPNNALGNVDVTGNTEAAQQTNRQAPAGAVGQTQLVQSDHTGRAGHREQPAHREQHHHEMQISHREETFDGQETFDGEDTHREDLSHKGHAASTEKTTHPDPATTSAEADNSIVIDVKDLVRRFGDFTAVDSTTFNVRRGEIFGLLGPNGAGKTTTFRMLCGLLPATSGQAEVAGMDMRKARAVARQRIGYVSQKFALYGNLSVMENLRFFGRAYGLMGKRLSQRLAAVTTQFELQRYEKIPAGQLPGGVKQRLAMAVGLLHEPDVLFLDEPTSGTDPLARRGFWQRITRLAGGGTTIVITTHFMEEAEYCDRIVIQDAGKLVAYGTPDQVRAQADGTDRMTMEAAFIRIVEQGRSQRSDSKKVAA